MQTKWNELASPVRESVIMGLLGGTSAFAWFSLLASEWVSTGFAPFGNGTPIIAYSALLALLLASMLLFSGSLFLVFRKMTLETRGILGFTVLIASLPATFSILILAFVLGVILGLWPGS